MYVRAEILVGRFSLSRGAARRTLAASHRIDTVKSYRSEVRKAKSPNTTIPESLADVLTLGRLAGQAKP